MWRSALTAEAQGEGFVLHASGEVGVRDPGWPI